MHQEIINFLATQSITAQEWNDIKENNPAVAEEEIDIFSDLIWEGVLSKIAYLENIFDTGMHLFHLTEKEMKLIAVRVSQPGIDLRTRSEERRVGKECRTRRSVYNWKEKKEVKEKY